MLGHLIRKEMLDHILNLRFLILSVVGMLAIWTSLYSGYAYYVESLQDYRLAQTATEDRVRQLMTGNDWREITGGSFLVHRQPTPLSVFVRGLEPILGRSIRVSRIGGHPRRLKLSPAEAEPILGISSPLDLGLVVQVVLSLFVLLLTYDAVCGEKEAGTLRLTASFPISRHQLLVAKFTGVLIPTLLAFGLPLLLGIAVLLLAPEVQIMAGEWVRLGWILVIFSIYLTVFTCAGLFASCLTHRVPTSFVISLVFWVATVTVLPRLSLIAADGFRPTPSMHQHQAEKANIETALYGWRLEELGRWEEDYLKSTGQRWWKIPEGQEARYLVIKRTRREADERAKPEYDRMDEAFRNRYNARRNLAATLASVSPAFALKNVTVRLAGTGIDRQQRFMRAFTQYAEQHKQWWIKTKDRDLLRQARPEKYGEYKWDISDMPRFTYHEIWPEKDIQTALMDIGILALWGLFFFAGAYVAILRYDLR